MPYPRSVPDIAMVSVSDKYLLTVTVDLPVYGPPILIPYMPYKVIGFFN